jgi:hypothetical protein
MLISNQQHKIPPFCFTFITAPSVGNNDETHDEIVHIASLSVFINHVLFHTNIRGLEPVPYGGVLLSAPLHASTTLHHFLNVTVQFANKMRFKKEINRVHNVQSVAAPNPLPYTVGYIYMCVCVCVCGGGGGGGGRKLARD